METGCVFCGKKLEVEFALKAKGGTCEILKVDFHVRCSGCGKIVSIPRFLQTADDKEFKEWEKKNKDITPKYIG